MADKWPIYLGLAIGTLGVGVAIYEYWRRKKGAEELEEATGELYRLIELYNWRKR